MESSDNKTPRPGLNHRPRLLNAGIRDAPDKAASPSMLASLERDGKPGGAAASASPGRRRKYFAPLLAALVLVGGAAAFVYRSFDDSVASVSPAAPAAGPQRDGPVAQARSDATVSAVAPAAASAARAASSPAQIEVAAVASRAVESKASRSPSEASSEPLRNRNPLDKLAQSDAGVALPSASASAATQQARAATAAARPSTKAVASAKTVARVDGKTSGARKARTGEEDADTELVAAMIARLDRRGANPTTSAPERPTLAGDPGLAEKVRQCSSKTDLLDARRCRNKACETHWGKADACPASRAPKPLFGEHIDHGAPG